MFAKSPLVLVAPANKVFRWILSAALLAIVGETVATEGGGTSKALGVDTVMAGVMPPPGLRLTNFLARYDTSHTLDGSGNDRAGLSNFDLYVNAETFRLQYVWPRVKVWGATIETRVGFSAVVDAAVERIGQKLLGLGEREIDGRRIGEMVMDELRKMDKVAYIRFASVYRSFQDVEDFRDVMRDL